jgi:hypothetical protein
VELWAVVAHVRRRHWPDGAVALSDDAEARRPPLPQQETFATPGTPVVVKEAPHALVTSPTVPTMATMTIIVHPVHSWPRFMGG